MERDGRRTEPPVGAVGVPVGGEEIIKVENRDIPALQRVRYCMQDIRALEERREWQRGRAFKVTTRLTGMPRGGAGGGIESVLEKLDELDGEHALMMSAYIREMRAAERILAEISYPNMRTFVQMLYVDNVPPREVCERLRMTKWGFRRARTSVESAPSMRAVVWREKYYIEHGQA